MAAEPRERTRRLQERILGSDAAGAVFFPSPNFYYLTGFWEEPMERHLLLFVPAEGDPVLVAPELYEAQLSRETWLTDIETFEDGTDPTGLLERIGHRLNLENGTLLLDPTMWARFTLDLRSALPDARFTSANAVMGQLRARKDQAEISRIETASHKADSVMEAVRDLGGDAIGMTESQLAEQIREMLRGEGDDIAFEVVVGSGPNGAMPHHRHGDRTVESGDPVVLDFGLKLDHYPSDTTRTVVFDGSPSSEFEQVHDTVARAQQAAIKEIEPGVPASSIDAAARVVIESEGYGDAFVHRTGHGVGLDVHEEPYIVEGNDTPLEPGMVFSVEPGIYLKDDFGVRIEDLVVVTESGARRLNTTSRDWRV